MSIHHYESDFSLKPGGAGADLPGAALGAINVLIPGAIAWQTFSERMRELHTCLNDLVTPANACQQPADADLRERITELARAGDALLLPDVTWSRVAEFRAQAWAAQREARRTRDAQVDTTGFVRCVDGSLHRLCNTVTHLMPPRPDDWAALCEWARQRMGPPMFATTLPPPAVIYDSEEALRTARALLEHDTPSARYNPPVLPTGREWLVLVVEDDKSWEDCFVRAIRAAAQALYGQCTVDCESVTNAADAHKRLLALARDSDERSVLLLLDMDLPEVAGASGGSREHGQNVMKHARDCLPGAEIVICTGNPTLTDLRATSQAGVLPADFLIKGNDPESAYRDVHDSLVRLMAPAAEPLLLTFNEASREFTLGTKQEHRDRQASVVRRTDMRLENRALDLLVILARHPLAGTTPEVLAAHLWRQEIIVDAGTRIRNLVYDINRYFLPLLRRPLVERDSKVSAYRLTVGMCLEAETGTESDGEAAGDGSFRCVVVDNDPEWLDAVSTLLKQLLYEEAAGTAGTPDTTGAVSTACRRFWCCGTEQEAIETARTVRANMLSLDLELSREDTRDGMPGGLRVLQAVRATFPDVRALIFSQNDTEVVWRRYALREGIGEVQIVPKISDRWKVAYTRALLLTEREWRRGRTLSADEVLPLLIRLRFTADNRDGGLADAFAANGREMRWVQLPLPPRSLRLLQCLAACTREPISRLEMIRRMYAGEDEDIDIAAHTNRFDSTLRELRERLTRGLDLNADDPGAQIIRLEGDTYTLACQIEIDN